MLVLFCSACTQDNTRPVRSSVLTELNCDPEPTPDFDNKIVKLMPTDGSPPRDSIIEQLKKSREVFKPCREMIYRAIWKDELGKEITNSRVKIVATGKRWELAASNQDLIAMQFEFTEEEKAMALKNKMNKTLDHQWVDITYEGVIENSSEVWMHPIRSNQFSFTEITAFPEVSLPLRKGKKWSSQIFIESGWGDWDNQGVNSSFEVISKEDLVLKSGHMNGCWKVEAKTRFKLGNSSLTFWFHEKYGFVKQEYKTYTNSTLSFELEEINEKS